MRIAVLNRSSRIAGGIETYLDLVIPALARRGHEIGLWHETDGPADRATITLPATSPSWCVAVGGRRGTAQAVQRWEPDVVYVHAVDDPELEREAVTGAVAPAALFAHQYHGTCVSGTKTFKAPHARPCSRRFGWPCLLHYYPHRCGGLSPATMAREYRRQAHRFRLLPHYGAVITHSEHMRREYAKHGIPSNRLHKIPFPVRPPLAQWDAGDGRGRGLPASGNDPYRLAFLGRMERLKGGHLFLAALPQVTERLGHPVHAVLAGDGRERRAWETLGARVQRGTPHVTVEFTGWLDGDQTDALLASIHLLVVPSVWPEPLGMVGPEAGRRGVPAAAFAVGGITEWLADGVNGALAPGDRPATEGLAGAIVRCLESPAHYRALSTGACRSAARFNGEDHLAALLAVFDGVRR